MRGGFCLGACACACACLCVCVCLWVPVGGLSGCGIRSHRVVSLSVKEFRHLTTLRRAGVLFARWAARAATSKRVHTFVVQRQHVLLRRVLRTWNAAAVSVATHRLTVAAIWRAVRRWRLWTRQRMATRATAQFLMARADERRLQRVWWQWRQCVVRERAARRFRTEVEDRLLVKVMHAWHYLAQVSAVAVAVPVVVCVSVPVTVTVVNCPSRLAWITHDWTALDCQAGGAYRRTLKLRASRALAHWHGWATYHSRRRSQNDMAVSVYCFRLMERCFYTWRRTARIWALSKVSSAVAVATVFQTWKATTQESQRRAGVRHVRVGLGVGAHAAGTAVCVALCGCGFVWLWLCVAVVACVCVCDILAHVCAVFWCRHGRA